MLNVFYVDLLHWIFVTKYKSIRKIVQFVKLFKLFKLFKSCLRRIHLLLVSEVLPVDNVSIGSRCIGVDIPVFFLTSLDRVAWTINLRGSLLSQRHSISVLVDHVWGNGTETWRATGSESAVTCKHETSGTRDEFFKWEWKWQSFNYIFKIFIKKLN